MAIDNPNFLDLLLSVDNEKKTGKLHAYVRQQTGSLAVYTLYFNDGQLSDCKYGDLTGAAAVAKLVNESLVTVIFVRDKGTDFTKQPSMPKVDELMGMAGHIKEVEPVFDPKELLVIAVEALRDIYGDRAIELVNSIAKAYSPQNAPRAFADECVKLATNMVGNEKASKMMRPLYLT